MRTLHFVFALLLVVALSPRPAFAYLDPGTGSMVLQVILAGIAGVGVLAKMYWHRLLGVFRRGDKREVPLSQQIDIEVVPRNPAEKRETSPKQTANTKH